MMKPRPFFRQVDTNLFDSSEWTRGPWSPMHQHGGPPSALLAGRMEHLAGDGFRVMRVAVELPRPVPIGRLRLECAVRRNGRTVKVVEGRIIDSDGRVVLVGEALALAGGEVDEPPPPPRMDQTLPEDATPTVFPFFADGPSYSTATELRLGRGEFGDGDVMAWMRMRAPLLEDRAPSPLERVLVFADSGNGLSFRGDFRRQAFINADLHLALHRVPQGEWIGLGARTDYDSEGRGLAQTQLYDVEGPVGRGLQTLLIRRRA